MLDSHSLLRNVLLLLGAGFLVANVRILVQFVRYLRLRSSARARLARPAAAASTACS